MPSTQGDRREGLKKLKRKGMNRLVTVFLAAGVLAACTTAGTQQRTGSATLSSAQRSNEGADRMPADGKSASLSPKSKPDPQQMMGMKRSDLLVFLGTPTLRRSEPPAEVWQYLVRACVLHVFLFQNPGGDDYQVAYVESLPRAAPNVKLDDCLARLLEQVGESDT